MDKCPTCGRAIRKAKPPISDFDAPTPVLDPPAEPKTNGHVARLNRQRGLFDAPPPDFSRTQEPPNGESRAYASSPRAAPLPDFSPGLVGKARDILAAIRTSKQIEREGRTATDAEKDILARFCGFGPVALHLFPDPVTGAYKDASWERLGHELREMLTVEEYDSAKRTTFNAFYTSPVVMKAMHEGLARLGVPSNGLVLEPGCGILRFGACAPSGMWFIGVELDSLTARIAKLLHPHQDIRHQNFRDTKLPPLDGAIGNVPFADIKLDWKGNKFSLHDYFFAKSIDALKPGGVAAFVTTHFTLDKQNATIREHLAEQADFLGAIRLPSDAFKNEGTSVVADIIFLRKRAPGEVCIHCDPEWIQTGTVCLDGADIPINRYFINHPEMVLGTWSRKDRLYDAGYSLISNGDLAEQLKAAIGRLPCTPKERGLSDASVGPEPKNGQSAHAAFTPPPPQNHVSEGSFFIKNHSIYQILDGQGVQVVYGGKALTTHGALTGRRLAQLIRLRDLARRVLQSQNEDWPEYNRHEARLDLNVAYDSFVRAYGAINKTTISQTKDGTIRRMPNIVKFKEDPDAMLVMSLEEYDETTGKAEKATIMKKDVVGKTPPVTKVTSAEDGLLVSLNEKGRIDLPFISKLYGKPESQITDELGSLIYQNPVSKEWETADAYLSGNVRQKLKEAEAAGYKRNAEALAKVQPEDVLPGDIDANLGAPWIPEKDIQAFAADLFGVAPSSIPIAHVKKDALWTVSPDYSAEKSVPATADYGTPRANGTWLFEKALNMQSPTIYDPDPDDPDKRVVNPTETLAAKEKQKLIKERFKSWIFTDPDRTERLVRLYNDTYNNLRPRQFDGSHLTFPGKNPNITLNPHQTAAIWRCMTAGNTLLAHVVGAGKTWSMVAAGMKMKQAGLRKKIMYVVPNHLLEQFGREFMHLYPNAKLLIASKEDFTKERRKYLTAKIATGDWDGIVVTHSSFERIGMSKEYQAEFLREQIAEYEHLIHEHHAQKGSNRNILKTLEKQKAAREEKLTQLLAEDKKDTGLVFDDLGVDQLFIDEAHLFKNLETPTKMDRVAGIQTGGSERAFDLFLKGRYLDRKHSGHGLVFATGTPISNTLVEMYTLQRFLDPKGLSDRGIDHFDAWTANFGQINEIMELSPDGRTIRPRSRFSELVNYAELEQMYNTFADVQTQDMINLPRPAIAGGKAQVISCPMSEEQEELQQGLVKRYERIRNSRVDPREDNALAITTDGRKLALDARLLSSTALTPPISKLDLMADIVAGKWKEHEKTKATQLIFCDMGVNQTPWNFSVYDEIVSALVKRGIPKDQIATIGDADSDAKKQALFQKVRAGVIRVLIGSTTKMGAGTNVQQRLIAKHDLDAPWRPADVEQRDGRILRQGNMNDEVWLFRYVTEGSFDAYMWQALETKARSFAPILSGRSGLRRVKDISGDALSYAEVKAIASGNPAVLTMAEADSEMERLNIVKSSYRSEQYTAGQNTKRLPTTIKALIERAKHLATDIETMKRDHPLVIGSQRIAPDDAVVILGHRLEKLPEKVNESRRVPLGKYQGLEFGIILNANFAPDAYLEGNSYRTTMLSKNPGPRAVLNAVARLAETYPSYLDSTKKELALAESQLVDYRARLGQPFEHEAYMIELGKLRDQLRRALSEAPKEGEPSTAELAEKIKALRESRVIEAPQQREVKAASMEEPVTARIKREREAEQHAQATPLPPHKPPASHACSFSR